MHYEDILEGTFLSRENRFIAKVRINGKEVLAHVPNTGRCKELFLPQTPAVFTLSNNPKRKTRYTLIHIYKEELGSFVNIESLGANRIAKEGILEGKLPFRIPRDGIFPERTFGNSRFDFYLEGEEFKGYLEVKGVTLEEGGHGRFPDAPTVRGTKHLEELIAVKEEGLDAAVLFVHQMGPIKDFRPNDEMDPVFGKTLRKAAEKGVLVLAYDCIVKKEEVILGNRLPVLL